MTGIPLPTDTAFVLTTLLISALLLFAALVAIVLASAAIVGRRPPSEVPEPRRSRAGHAQPSAILIELSLPPPADHV